jgi:opacity protein-like surface antigen
MKRLMTMCVVIALISVAAQAAVIPDGSVSANRAGSYVTTYLNPAGYDFASNPYSLNLSSGTAVLTGTIDLTSTSGPGGDGWSSYYFWVSIKDNSGKDFQVVMNTDQLGGWHGIPAQPWDRVRMEYRYPGSGNPAASSDLLYFCTEGGARDDGGAYVYPSDRTYDISLAIDPVLKQMTLDVFALGRGEPEQWYNICTWDVSGAMFSGFDYSQTELSAGIWNPTETMSTVSWENMSIVPEPATLVLLGLGGLLLRKVKKA